MAKVVILGAVGKSISMDVDRFHSGGETIFAKSAHMEFGGKGFNRAVASARQGVETVFIAACGACDADGIGARARAHVLSREKGRSQISRPSSPTLLE